MRNILLITTVFTGILLTSCKTTSHVCDAYTFELKKQKMKELKEIAVIANENVHN